MRKLIILILLLLTISIGSCKKDEDTQGTVGLYSYFDESGKWGYIDKDGNIKINPQWDIAYDFYLGYGIVSNNSLWGLIDQNGNEVIPLKYQGIGNFEADMKSIFNPKFLVKAKLNGLWGFIDEHDNVVIPFSYKMVSDFSDGLAAFRTNIQYGYINENNEVVLPATYDGYGYFKDGLCWVGLLSGGILKWGVINKTGVTVFPFNYDNIYGSNTKYNWYIFNNGVTPYFINGVESGFMNSSGEILFGTIGAAYNWVDNFSEGVARVNKDGLMGYINVNGEEVVVRQFSDLWSIVNGNAPYKQTADGLYGIVEKDGSILMTPQFLNAYNLNGDLGWVLFPDSTNGYVNKYGDIVWRSSVKLGNNPKNLLSKKGIKNGID